MKRGILLLLWFLFGINLLLSGQPLAENAVLRNYFRNPLDIPMKLSANFGELRPDHWHMGLDIRTNARENMQVHAAAEGYVAHVGVRSSGYGRFIIINHPNGTSTLYAHLNDFNEALESYVTAQQYSKESWAIELDFNKDQFPVNKGSFIAFSGNTGGSQGPHLHFEIIETKTQKRLNPLLFNFYIDDYVPPTLLKLAIYDRSRSIYAQTPLQYPLKYTDSGYVPLKGQTIRTSLNRISFAIQAYDRIERGGSEDGIYAAQLAVDDVPEISFVLDSIGFEERVYMNAHIDYRYDYKGGPYFQMLTALPGNRSNVYKKLKGDGVINLDDTLVHTVRIDVNDPHENKSTLNFSIMYDDSLPLSSSQIFAGKLVPNKRTGFERDDFRFLVGENNLYDTVPMNYYRSPNKTSYALSDIHTINDASYPLHGESIVSIRPGSLVTEDMKDKLLIRLTSGKTNSVRKAVIENNGWVSAKFGDFGSFQVFTDPVPPEINSPGKGVTINLSSLKRMVFTPTDNFGVIKSFRAELDRRWLRFTNDKGRNWIYNFDEHFDYGVYELKTIATDLVGNTTERSWWVRRAPYTPPPPKKKGAKKKTGSKKKKK